MSSFVRCKECGEQVAITEIDEFTPADETRGINLPISDFDEDEIHLFRGDRNNNLFIHYTNTENSRKSGTGDNQ